MRLCLRRPSLAALLPLLVAIAQLSAQQPGFARIFDNHMVLQRQQPVRVWGWGELGQAAVIRFGEQEHRASVDGEGRWAVTLAPMPAEATGRSLSLELGGAQFMLEDVLVGDVWICGGQSNMAWTVRGTRDADLEIPSADDALLRFVRLPNEARGAPRLQRGKGDQGVGRRVPCRIQAGGQGGRRPLEEGDRGPAVGAGLGQGVQRHEAHTGVGVAL